MYNNMINGWKNMEKKNIIGYYDYYYDKHEYSRIGKGSGTIREEILPSDVQKFFHNDKRCPFCSSQLENVFLGIRSEPKGGDLYESGKIYECKNCGWWTYKFRVSEDADLIDEVRSYYTDSRYYGIMKSYNITDKELPIEVLSAELKKKPDILYDINPYKLEELSQEILKGVYDCKVNHVGKTGDGGVDLLILEADEPILVQVKRRKNPNHVELVKGVREFVGTLFIEGQRKGIYISTAKRYSKGSKETAEKLIRNRKLDYFELIDYDKLCSLMGNINEKKPWSSLVDYFYKCKNSKICDNEIEIRKYKEELDLIYSYMPSKSNK